MLRPAFWAWVFDQYVHLRGLSDAVLAAQLGLSERDFQRLGLYLRPRADHFEADVTRTAAALGVDRFQLAQIVRLVDAVTARTSADGAPRAADAGLLLAARTRRGRRHGTDQGSSNEKEQP
jgi:hypothetical protein